MAEEHKPKESEFDSLKNTNEIIERVQKAANYVLSKLTYVPEVALVLGSGLNGFANELTDQLIIPYNDIPFMPTPSIAGHDGKLIVGTLKTKKVLCFSGRVHSYEGIPFYVVCFIPRLAAALGCKILFLTNASGGATKGMPAGSFLLIRDHLKLSRRDPLFETFGDNRLGDPSLTNKKYWSARLGEVVKSVAEESTIPLYEGTYTWCQGPNYETRNEVSNGMILGTNCFGMSTAVEAIVATSLGLEVVGVSVITNDACGFNSNSNEENNEILSHDEVKTMANQRGPYFQKLVATSIEKMESISLPQPSKDFESVPVASRFEPTLYSSKQVEESVQFLKSRGVDGSALSVVGFRSIDGLKAGLNVKLTLSLSEIPHFPHLTTNFKGGQLIYGTAQSGSAVLLIKTTTDNGLVRHEGLYVAVVLRGLGAGTLLVEAIDLSAAASASVVCDVLNWTSDEPVSHFPHISQTPQLSLPYRLVDPKLTQTLEKLTSLPLKKYGWLTGPSSLSDAEERLLKLLSVDIYGLTSLDVAYAARGLGLRVGILAGSEGVITPELVSSLSKEESTQLPPLPDSYQFQQNISIPLVAKPYLFEEVDEAAVILNKVFKEVPNDLIALFDFTGSIQTIRKLADKRTSLTEIPLFMKYSTHKGTVFHIKGKDTNLLVFTFDKNDTNLSFRPFRQDWTFATRVIGHLKAKGLLMLAPVVSHHEEDRVPEKLYTIIDHVNFVGKSELIGNNEDRWGLRFFDVSDVYSQALRGSISNLLNSHNLEAENVVCSYSLNPAQTTEADLAALLKIGGRVSSADFIQEALLARHMTVPAAVIAVNHNHSPSLIENVLAALTDF